MNHTAREGTWIINLMNPRNVFNHWRGFTSGSDNTAAITPRVPGGSFPQGRTVGYSGRTDYQQLQQRLGRRTYMAGDSHASSSSSGAGGTVLAIGAGIFLACLGIPLLFMGLNNVTGGSRTIAFGETAKKEIEYRIVGPSGNTVVTTNPAIAQQLITVATTPSVRYVPAGPPLVLSGMPDPNVVYQQQLGAGNVTKVRVHCPQDNRWVTLDNGECGRWTPN